MKACKVEPRSCACATRSPTATPLLIERLYSEDSAVAAHADLLDLVPQLLPRAFGGAGCRGQRTTELGPQGVGDEDLAFAWECEATPGVSVTYLYEVARRGRVDSTLLSIAAPRSDQRQQIVGWAHMIDGHLRAAPQ